MLYDKISQITPLWIQDELQNFGHLKFMLIKILLNAKIKGI